MASIVMATDSFTGFNKLTREDVTVHKGDLVWSEDPIVKNWPEYFGPPTVRGKQHPDVEQATARPGEKRGA